MTHPAAHPYPDANNFITISEREKKKNMELLIINPLREKNIISTMSNDMNIFNYSANIEEEKFSYPRIIGYE